MVFTFGPEWCESSVSEPRQSGIMGSNPESSVVIHEQAGDEVPGKSWCRAFVVNGEPESVKPCEAAFCTEPEVTICRLRDGRYGIFRQSLFVLPRLLNELGQISRRIKAALCARNQCQS